MAKKKQKSGWEKIKDSGKRVITLVVTPEEHALLTEAAEQDRRAISQWVLVRALRDAREEIDATQASQHRTKRQQPRREEE